LRKSYEADTYRLGFLQRNLYNLPHKGFPA
jgi:hypothetical protein